MTVSLQHEDGWRLTLPGIRFPVELEPPEGFRLEDPATWPRVEGRLEYVDGRLLYMPPCGDTQADVVTDVVYLLRDWLHTHTDYRVGTNEAGMLLDGDARGADAAVWRKDDLGGYTGGLRRVAPVLAVEVAGRDEGEAKLLAKASWYLRHGVPWVWLVLPESREVLVVGTAVTRRYGLGASLESCSELPGLQPSVEEFFTQLG